MKKNKRTIEELHNITYALSQYIYDTYRIEGAEALLLLEDLKGLYTIQMIISVTRTDNEKS